jgi:hypothetical protein
VNFGVRSTLKTGTLDIAGIQAISRDFNTKADGGKV